MNRVNITNYDGDKGYIEGERESLRILEYKGNKYAIRANANPDHHATGAFRITHEGEEDAQAVEIKNKGLIKILGEEYWRETKKESSIRRLIEKNKRRARIKS